MIVVHVTHEAVEKIGGIGAVIAGLMTADAYARNVSRTILLGPLLRTDQPVNRRLGEGGHVIYSTLDAIHAPPWRDRFRPIERTYDVGIIYGTRSICDPYSGKCVKAEVLLVNVFHANRDRLNQFKGQLFKNFSVPSERFEKHLGVRGVHPPGRAGLRGAEGDRRQRHAAGRPGLAGAGDLPLARVHGNAPGAEGGDVRLAQFARRSFYAHEVASVRPIVEKMPGHDTMFYNTLTWAESDGKTMEDVFPAVFENYKHPLVKAARYCDHVFAVGDFVEKRAAFLDPHFRTMEFNLVYNGVPALPLTLDEKHASRDRMRKYARKPPGPPAHVDLHARLPTGAQQGHLARPARAARNGEPAQGPRRVGRVLHARNAGR